MTKCKTCNNNLIGWPNHSDGGRIYVGCTRCHWTLPIGVVASEEDGQKIISRTISTYGGFPNVK